MEQKFWLMKTEPSTYGWLDLVHKPQHQDRWEGVRNYQARNYMRDDFRPGHEVFVYHSSTAEPAIIGVAKVVGPAYPDPTALDPQSPYFDAKSLAQGVSRWFMVDLQAHGVFARPITLKELRADLGLQSMALLQRGQRLSIQPVKGDEWLRISRMSSLNLLLI